MNVKQIVDDVRLIVNELSTFKTAMLGEMTEEEKKRLITSVRAYILWIHLTVPLWYNSIFATFIDGLLDSLIAGNGWRTFEPKRSLEILFDQCI